MEVKVKKSVLFNLLKKRLSENRTYGDNPGGNFVHPFDINDGPIIPDSQMSTQLSNTALQLTMRSIKQMIDLTQKWVCMARWKTY